MIPTATASAVTVVTNQVVRLTLRFVEATWSNLFDRVEVWRSRLGEGGPYSELTGEGWASAVLVAGGDAAAPQMAPVVGKDLKLRVNDSVDISVTFTGTDPLTPAQIATQVQTAGNGLLVCTAVGTLVEIKTAQPGAAAVLQVVGGEAAPILGLSTEEPASVAFGTEPRLGLVAGQEVYVLIDPHGAEGYFYRTRFRNSATGAVSAASQPISAKATTTLDPSSLIRVYLDAVDAFGRPMQNQKVLVDVPTQYITASGKNVLGAETFALTDATGHVEFYVVRGLKLRVAVAGTALVREVTVPTDPAITSINLFDPAYGTDDVFKVQESQADFAVRRTV